MSELFDCSKNWSQKGYNSLVNGFSSGPSYHNQKMEENGSHENCSENSVRKKNSILRILHHVMAVTLSIIKLRSISFRII